jgi:hypothetical protein
MLLFSCEISLAPTQKPELNDQSLSSVLEAALLTRMFSAQPSISSIRAMPWRQLTHLTVQLIAMINGWSVVESFD